jgi:hypothetical protein
MEIKMTNEQYTAVIKAYDDLIKCFRFSNNIPAINTTQVHKALLEVERENEISKEVAYETRKL